MFLTGDLDGPFDVPPAAARLTPFGEFPGGGSAEFESLPARSVVRQTECADGADFDPAVDPPGQRLAFASTRHAKNPDLYIKAIGSAAVTQVTSDPGFDIQPEFSPDGSTLAFVSNRAGTFDVWTVGVDGQGLTQITNSSWQEVHPTWSPDGRRLAYCALNPRSGQWELWLVDLQRPGARKFLGYGLYPRWSPSDELIVYQRARERGQRLFSIWTLRLVNGEPRFPTEIAASATEAYILPTFSPDGASVAFCAVPGDGGSPAGHPPTSGDVWIVPSGGGEAQRLTEGSEGNFSPTWARDGNVYFTSHRHGRESIWSARPVIEGPTTRPAVARRDPEDSMRGGAMPAGEHYEAP